MNKNSNLIISAGTFILGAVYLLSDSASINGNVIGASGGSLELASVVGMFMIVLSGIYFLAHASSADKANSLENVARTEKVAHADTAKEMIKRSEEERKYGHSTTISEDKVPEEKHPDPK